MRNAPYYKPVLSSEPVTVCHGFRSLNAASKIILGLLVALTISGFVHMHQAAEVRVAKAQLTMLADSRSYTREQFQKVALSLPPQVLAAAKKGGRNE